MAALAGVGAYAATAATAPVAAAVVPAPELAPGTQDGAAVVEEESLPPEDHERGPWPWIALLLVLLLIAGGVTAFILTRHHTEVVPTVTGEQLSVASTQLQNAGFAVST